MLAMLGALGTNIVGNIILIPLLGFLGPAWAFTISEAMYCFATLSFPKHTLPIVSVGRASLPSILGVMGCLLTWLIPTFLAGWARLPLGVVLYLLIWLLVAQKNEKLWHFISYLWNDLWARVRKLFQTLLKKA
jgi:O-antigen/teichoic acid export membrane protein